MELDKLLNAAKAAFPPTSGRLKVDGLGGEVEVLWDKWGVPHVYARTLEDLLLTEGYLHARFRLFQMELYRRRNAGRLSEVFGEATLESDRGAREVGLHRVARRSADRLRANPGAEVYRLLEAYRRGVNAGIRAVQNAPPLELSLLGLEPTDWELEDSIAIVAMMDWEESRNLDYEVLREVLVEKLGEEKADRVFPLHEGALTLEALGGSNGWAVSPGKSTTGGALLANDPHLTFTNPIIWFLVHLSCDEGGMDVAGVSLPGVPGIVIGHNAHLGWGITNLEADVQDLFRLELNPENPRQYRFGDSWLDFEVVDEPIVVKGRDHPVPHEVRVSRFGPVVERFERGGNTYRIPLPHEYALKWSGHLTDPADSIRGFLGLNRATCWGEVADAVSSITLSGHNLMYADREGNVVHQHFGVYAVRGDGDGTRPNPGDSDQFDWKGLTSFEQLWRSENPERGYVFTANYNPDEAPGPGGVLIGKDKIGLSRFVRLRELLASRDKISPKDCEEFQLDTVSTEAREYLPRFMELLEPALPLPGDVPPGVLEELREWDFNLGRGSRAAALYKLWLHCFFERVLVPVLDDDTYRMFASNYPFDPLRLIEMCRVDLGEEGLRDLVVESFQDAVRWLSEALGPKTSRWTWGNLHKVEITHPFASAAEEASVLNIGPFKTGGDRNTLNNGIYEISGREFRVTGGPSLRMVLDLADWDESKWVIPGGQAGLPFHPHYNDLIKLWARGKYFPMCFSREAVEKHLESRQILEP
ncbi:MAG: penicillin acylase family protein [Promethearchaeota archaeon]